MLKLILTTLTLLSVAYSKIVTQKFTLKELKSSNWHYLTKFQADFGSSNFEFSMIFVNSNKQSGKVPLKLEVYLDTEWNYKALELEPCQRSQHARINTLMEVPVSDSLSPVQFDGQLNQNVRPHVWFFAISDCNRTISSTFHDDDQVELHVRLHVRNSNGSEFSQEESGSLGLCGFLTLANLFLFYFIVQYSVKDFKKNGEWDWPLIVLIVALVFETLHNINFFLHLFSYSGNGVGITFLSLGSELLQVLSNFTLTGLLILISWGWSINYIQMNNLNMTAPLALIVGFLQVLVMGLGKFNDDMHNKYHPYDGWVGWIIGLIEVCLFIYFYAGIQNTLKQSNDKIKQFIMLLSAFGSLYFLGFPILLVISKFVGRYGRYKFILVGTNAIRLIAIMCLSRLFTSKKNGYSEISYKNNSFLDRGMNKFE